MAKNTVLSREEKNLLEKILREYISNLESESYRATENTGKVFPFYTEQILRARDLRDKLLRGQEHERIRSDEC